MTYWAIFQEMYSDPCFPHVGHGKAEAIRRELEIELGHVGGRPLRRYATGWHGKKRENSEEDASLAGTTHSPIPLRIQPNPYRSGIALETDHKPASEHRFVSAIRQRITL